jgi:hypothetical protein
MDLKGDLATAFSRRILALAVDENPGRVSFVLLFRGISRDFPQGVPGYGDT